MPTLSTRDVLWLNGRIATCDEVFRYYGFTSLIDRAARAPTPEVVLALEDAARRMNAIGCTLYGRMATSVAGAARSLIAQAATANAAREEANRRANRLEILRRGREGYTTPQRPLGRVGPVGPRVDPSIDALLGQARLAQSQGQPAVARVLYNRYASRMILERPGAGVEAL